MPRLGGDKSVLLSDDKIGSEALRLLKNKLVYVPSVHRNLEREFGKIGDTISIRKPFRVKSASGATLVKQPIVDEVVALTIDHQEHVGLNFTQKDRALNMDSFGKKILDTAMSQLAHVLDRSIADAAATGFFFGSGTPGTIVTSDNWNDAAAFMEMVGVPDDGMVRSMLNPLDAAAIDKELKGYANQQMVQNAIQRHYRGRLANMDTYKTAQQPTHTVGALGGVPLVNGATQSGTSLVTDAWAFGVAGLLNIGDCFTIAGVYEVNPRTYQSTGRLQRFVVTATAASDGAGNATLSISPGINDGNLTTPDGNGVAVSTKAYQNVSALPADNAIITVIGTAGTTYRQDICFHRDAIALAMVNFRLPEEAKMAYQGHDPATGIALTITGGFDINIYEAIKRVDILWGVKVIYPELGHRIWSDNQ